MKMDNDFDETSTEEFDESALETETMGFDDAPNPIQEEDENEEVLKSKEEVQKVEEKEKAPYRASSGLNKTENNMGIKVDIKSIEGMISSLEFASQNLIQAVNRVSGNAELNHILEVLSQIKTNQFENFQNIEKNINLDQVERMIEEKILSSVAKVDKKITQNVKVIESKTQKATDQFKKYAEAFEDPDIIEQFSNIEKIETWTKKFKFKSIIFSSIFAAVVSGVVTAGGVKYFYKIQADKVIQQERAKAGEVAAAIASKNIQIYKGDTATQIIFSRNEKVSYFTVEDGRKVIELEK